MIFLTSELWFPNPKYTDESGVLAVGGDLSPERLMLAYKNGIFPWYNEDEPILWWCPKDRMVLFPDRLHIAKSMRPLLKKDKFQITFNQAFDEVIMACAEIKRNGQNGTWISDEIIKAYKALHTIGYAHSIETWQEGKLVGGLYGVYLKDSGVFCGESMFSKASNASKFAFIKMVEYFKEKNLKIIDCQIHTPHLKSLGAELIDRKRFLEYLS